MYRSWDWCHISNASKKFSQMMVQKKTEALSKITQATAILTQTGREFRDVTNNILLGSEVLI